MGSKGGKGGGKPSAPKINIPSGMQDLITQAGVLGQYESAGLNLPYDIGNYYMSLATGGGGPQYVPPQYETSQAGLGSHAFIPDILTQTYGAGGVPTHEAVQNYWTPNAYVSGTGAQAGGGVAAGGGPASGIGGPAGTTVAGGGMPMLVSGPPGSNTTGIYMKNPNLPYPEFIPVKPGEDPAQAMASYQQTYHGSTLASGFAGGGATGGGGQPPARPAAGPAKPALPGTQVGGTTFPGTTNPFMSEFQQMLGQEFNTTQQIPGIEQATNALGANVNQEIGDLSKLAPQQMAAANQWLGQTQAGQAQAGQGYQNALAELAARNQGVLLPGQEAMINTQTQAAQNQLKQQLANMGLGSSTMGTELGGELGLAGAGQKGALMQENVKLAQQDVTSAIAQEQQANQQVSLAQAEQQIAQGDYSLLQNAQKLSLGVQTLSLGEQQALFNQFSNIANQTVDAQSIMFNQAMQGYGMAGQFLNQVLAPMGMSMQGYNSILQANESYARNQTDLEVAQLSAQQSQANSMGGLFQGLGSLFGGSGGSGGLIGGLGGLLGGGAGVLGSAGGASLGAGEAAAAALGAAAFF